MDFDTREIRKMEIKEKRVKDKKKSSIWATLVIIFLLFLNLGFLGYIFYDKGIFNTLTSSFQKKEIKTDKNISKTLSLTDEEVSTLYNYLKPIKEKFVMTSSILKEELSEDEKKALALALLKEENFDKTEKEDHYRLKSLYLEEATIKIFGKETFDKKKDMIESYYQKYSSNLEGKMRLSYNELCDCYDVTLETKEEEEFPLFDAKLVKAVQKDKQIILTEKVIYPLLEEDGVSIYRDWQLTNLLDKIDVNDISNHLTVDNYLSDASEIIYTFQKEGEDYHFISSKIKEKS